MHETLYLKLRQINSQQIELRYAHPEAPEYRSLVRSLASIGQLLQNAESDYYTSYPGRLDRLGQTLHHWLDGDDRLLSQAIQGVRRRSRSQYLILAIDAREGLAHLPWELLHDGANFLVAGRRPTVLPVRWKEGSEATQPPEHRPLRLLFMATSPRNVPQVLDFEQEEALIIAATQRQKLNLVVEESGNLQELAYLVSEYGHESRFDVFHLTGHATLSTLGPRFYTESETGEAVLASADEIAQALPYPPRLVFLSGCHTGAMGDRGVVASLAEQLTDLLGGIPVLGWSRRVQDAQASQAAATLYDSLAIGHSLPMALARTYQDLIAQEYQSWHMLRLFVAGAMPEPLVTAPRSRQRHDPAFPQHGTTFFNQRERQGEVADYKSFVGRRLMLQQCISALKGHEYAGVLLWGQGGVGKSSLAHRISFRLRDSFRTIVLSDRFNNLLDIQKVRSQLAAELRDPELRRLLFLNQSQATLSRYSAAIDADSFAYSLSDVLAKSEERFLFLIDDFEGNFTRQADGSPLLRAGELPELSLEAIEALQVLTRAIMENPDRGHRLVITSRYQLQTSQARQLAQIQLERLNDGDVAKKLQRLDASRNPLDQALREQIVRLANGNPRLLEWLFKLAHGSGLQLQERLSAEQERFKESIFIRQILAQLPDELQQLLGRIAIFQLPVPEKVVRALCADMELEPLLQRASALGLIEVIHPLHAGDETHYSVSQIIAGELPQPDPAIRRQAADLAFAAWIVPPAQDMRPITVREAGSQEVYRLARSAAMPSLLVQTARALCATWSLVGKNHQELIMLCADVLSQQPDHQLYGYLANALFESGRRFELGQESLDGFAALDRAIATCPPEDKASRVSLLVSYAFWLKDYGNLTRANELASQAEQISREVEDGAVRVSALHQLAAISCDLGNYEQGEALYREAEQLSSSLPSSQAMAGVIVRTDAAFSLYGRDLNRPKVLAALEQSYAIFGEAESLINYAATSCLIARVHYDAKNFSKAADLVLQALDLCKRGGLVRAEAVCQLFSASVDQELDQAGAAISKYEAALATAGRLEHLGLLAEGHRAYGYFRMARQEYEQAEEHFHKARQFSEQASNLFGLFSFEIAMIQLALAKEQGLEEAIERCAAMLEQLHEHDFRFLAITTLNYMGDAYKQLKRHDEAFQCYRRALELRIHANYPGLSYAQFQLGQLYDEQQNWAAALEHYQRSLEISEDNGSIDWQVSILETIADLHTKERRYEEALLHRERAGQLRTQLGTAKGDAALDTTFKRLDLLARVDRLDQAMPSLQEAERLLEPLPPSYMKALYLDRAAIFNSQLQRAEQAVRLWEQAYQILLDELKSFHLLTAFAQLKLAYGLLQLRRDHEARPYLEAAGATLRTRLGSRHEVAQALAAALADAAPSSALTAWARRPIGEIAELPLPDRSAESMRIVVGPEIVPVFDPDQGSRLLERLAQLRLDLLEQEQFLLPYIHITDDAQLDGRIYRLNLDGKLLFEGRLPAPYAVASNKRPAFWNPNVTREPGFDHTLLWVSDEAQLPAASHTFDAEDVVLANLMVIIKQNKDRILAAIQ
jgi:tetratricopeptide (TPR) repeat protein